MLYFFTALLYMGMGGVGSQCAPWIVYKDNSNFYSSNIPHQVNSFYTWSYNIVDRVVNACQTRKIRHLLALSFVFHEWSFIQVHEVHTVLFDSVFIYRNSYTL